LNKAEKSGITIMKMDAGMDTGDVIDTISFPLKFERIVANLIEAIQKV
jgi:methionyl-tRNA formyltransferase